MKTRFRIGWLLIASLVLPVYSPAQSKIRSQKPTQNPNGVVSVRELSIPPKAFRSFEQGAELLIKKDAVGSLPHFQRAIAEFAGYYEAYYEMGVADLKLQRMPDAEQAFRKSIELSGSEYASPLLALGAVLGYDGKFTEAEEVTRQGIDLDPAMWTGHYYLGWALFGLNRLEEAEKSVREALRLKADSTEALHLLADIHSHEKNYAALVDDLNEYLKLDPDSPAGARAKVLRDNVQRILSKSDSNTDLAQAVATQ